MNLMRPYDLTGLGELVYQIRHGGTAQSWSSFLYDYSGTVPEGLDSVVRQDRRASLQQKRRG
jgi:hypothetical protein